jgi:hypothetical protein
VFADAPAYGDHDAANGCAPVMYTIELTSGLAWDAPVVEVHSVSRAKHIVDVERMAQAYLAASRRTSKHPTPTNYRILDPLGKCVQSRIAPVPSHLSSLRAGRTCWG